RANRIAADRDPDTERQSDRDLHGHVYQPAAVSGSALEQTLVGNATIARTRPAGRSAASWYVSICMTFDRAAWRLCPPIWRQPDRCKGARWCGAPRSTMLRAETEHGSGGAGLNSSDADPKMHRSRCGAAAGKPTGRGAGCRAVL